MAQPQPSDVPPFPSLASGKELLPASALLGTQLPLRQVPLVHGVPSALAGVEQSPLVASHMPASWHSSRAVQEMAFEPTQTPELQVSVRVQALPSLQEVPLEA